MRFQTSTTAQFPPATTAAFGSPLTIEQYDTWTVRRKTVTQESGHFALLIPGESKTLTIVLKQLLISWVGVEDAGKIELRSPELDPLVIFQSVPAGQIIIPCYDELRWLNRYGLRAANNSVGGQYSITVHYTIKEP